MIKIFVIILSLLFPSISLSATYYVDNATTSTTWATCNSPSTPCTPVTAMNNASAGDVVFFRGGTYVLNGNPVNSTYTGTSTYQGWLQPVNSGVDGSPITFKAYPGEVPIMDAAEQSAGSHACRAFGTNGADYITFEGFKFIGKGGVEPGGIIISAHDTSGTSDHCIIRNCEFVGADVGNYGDNVSGIRSEKVNYLLIENNLFYNYHTDMEASGSNVGCLEAYDSNYMTVTHNEFRDSSAAIFWKRNNNYMVASYNYIHNVFWPLEITAGTAGPGDATDAKVFHNLITGYTHPPRIYGISGYFIRGLEYYNNTTYSAVSDGAHDSELRIGDTIGVNVYNNVIGGSGTYLILIGADGATLTTFDHNAYLPYKEIYTRLYGTGVASYATLAAWQSSGELNGGGNPGVGSIDSTTSSIFVNTSGLLNMKTDFEVKGAVITGGRSGVNMGANVSLVGCQPFCGPVLRARATLPFRACDESGCHPMRSPQ